MLFSKSDTPVRPVVCAVGEAYVICIPAEHEALMSVWVDGTEYTNDECGVKRSNCFLQKFTVPVAALDRAGKYKVVYEKFIKRLAYSSLKEKAKVYEFRFTPLTKGENINIYHLSDVHGLKKEAIRAGSYFGNTLDLLILNGDISSSSQTPEEALLPMAIAYEITRGEKPCIITRGNHDLRGRYAEKLGEFYPTYNGKFYYHVNIGNLWILVLDCGEDKDDGHKEYAGTVCFKNYRKAQTEYLEALSGNVALFDNEKIKYKFVLSHIPFMHTDFDPAVGKHEFDIEIDTYTKWVRILNEKIKPQFGLFGHVHTFAVCGKDSKYNTKGFLSPMIIGGKPLKKERNLIGTAITLNTNTANVLFTDARNQIVGNEIIYFSKT